MLSDMISTFHLRICHYDATHSQPRHTRRETFLPCHHHNARPYAGLGHEEVDHKRHGGNPHEWLDLPDVLGGERDDNVPDEAKADARGNRVGHGDARDDEEGGKSVEKVRPVYLDHLGEHEEADIDEGTAGRCPGDHRDERLEEDGDKKEQTAEDG